MYQRTCILKMCGFERLHRSLYYRVICVQFVKGMEAISAPTSLLLFLLVQRESVKDFRSVDSLFVSCDTS